MELILRKIEVKDIIFDSQTKVKNGVLSIDADEIRELLLSDERILEIDIDIARPGESIRIIHVKDVIEPRAKVDGEAFPGIDGKIDEVGKGITYVLKNCSVITTGPIVDFQEGIIDMKGPLTEYTPFSKLNNLVLNIKKNQELLLMSMRKQ